MKTCHRCGIEKPIEAFHKCKSAKDGVWRNCRECNHAVRAEYYKIRREHFKKVQRDYNAKSIDTQRDSRLRRLYGMGQPEYDMMLARQGGVCSICGGVNKGARRLYVDHDHATGAVRELLCNMCNRLIGCARDDVIIMVNAIKYLERNGNGISKRTTPAADSGTT